MTHINAPGYVGDLIKKALFSEITLTKIKQYVGDAVNLEFFSNYEFILEIKNGQDWFGLDAKYIFPDEPLVKRNSSENEQTIELKVTWRMKEGILAQILCKSYSP